MVDGCDDIGATRGVEERHRGHEPTSRDGSGATQQPRYPEWSRVATACPRAVVSPRRAAAKQTVRAAAQWPSVRRAPTAWRVRAGIVVVTIGKASNIRMQATAGGLASKARAACRRA